MKSDNLESEENIMAEKISHYRHVKNMGTCACLGHVTSRSVSYGSFHLGQMKANL